VGLSVHESSNMETRFIASMVPICIPTVGQIKVMFDYIMAAACYFLIGYYAVSTFPNLWPTIKRVSLSMWNSTKGIVK
jgi:hypothetical protein